MRRPVVEIEVDINDPRIKDLKPEEAWELCAKQESYEFSMTEARELLALKGKKKRVSLKKGIDAGFVKTRLVEVGNEKGSTLVNVLSLRKWVEAGQPLAQLN